MADQKLSALTEFATPPPNNDEVYIRDVSEAASLESKRITIANLLAGGVSDPHGAAQHSDVTRELFIGAAENFANNMTPGEYATPLYATILTDGSAHKIALNFKLPDDFVSFISVKLVWISAAESGNMYWALAATYRASGESYVIHSDGPAAGVTATGGSGKFNVQEPANALTLSNLALGDYVSIYAQRTGSHADDTLNNDVYAVGLLFTYTAHQ